MGSLTSRPKAPSRALTQQSVSTSPPVAVTPAPTLQPTPSAAVPNEDAQQSAARTDNLLTRGRGIFGTVLTGFRGLLAQAEAKQRKSLLGE